MKNYFKLVCVSLLTLLMVSSAALAEQKVKVVVQNEYKPDESTYYVTQKTSSDLGLVSISVPAEGTQTTTTTTKESVYVDGKLVGETTKIRTVGISTGYHAVEVRDSDGKVIWTEPRIHVVKHETTIVSPE